MNTPLYDRLINYNRQNRISFAMPGHKNGRGLPENLLCCDVTELDATENLHCPQSAVTESKKRLARMFECDESFIVTGGSTACIHAMIAAALKPGDTLLASADCHMSVINACALMGIKLKFIPRETDKDFLTAKPLTDIESYIDGADAVIITSPTYYGVCAEVEKIAKTCHERKIPLLTDEAHGAHFIKHELFPKPAVTLGADAVCQSAHKTLNALTGAAFLHIRGDMISRERIRKAIAMIETSSPSYVIASSAEWAINENNTPKWGEIIEKCRDFRKKIAKKTKIKILENDDPTRLVLNFSAYEISGIDVSGKLSGKYGIDAEMADLLNIVLIVTASNTAEDMDRLYAAIMDIISGLKKRARLPEIPLPPSFDGVISPSDAFFSNANTFPLEQCVGKISASSVTPYPPGIPVICAGAPVTAEQIEYILRLEKAGAEIDGMRNGNIEILNGESI